MLEENHPVFKKPENENAKIWRFMDFTKFVSMLEKKALFFCRSDLLGDPFEGSFTKINQQMRPVWYNQAPNFQNVLSKVFENFRYFTFLNCWHLNEYESDAMWKLYLEGGKGVAVQSTYKRLKESFNEDSRIGIGKVIYVDYDSATIPEGNTYWPFVHKRKSFEHENELRAIIHEMPKNLDMGKRIDPPNTPGLYIPINLDTLIENIYVDPTSQKWFDELIQSIIKKYGIDKKIHSSKLSERPVF